MSGRFAWAGCGRWETPSKRSWLFWSTSEASCTSAASDLGLVPVGLELANAAAASACGLIRVIRVLEGITAHEFPGFWNEILEFLIYSGYTHDLRIIYASFAHHLRRNYAGITHHLRSIYAVFTHHLRSIYASFTQYLLKIYASFTHNLRII